MLVWLNGPFGAGKTQVAFELHRRLPGSAVCDPEPLGFGLQSMTPPALRPDFQEFRAWRAGVVEVLDKALTSHPGDLLVPMTLVVPAYHNEIVGGLRARGHPVTHVALLADRAVVLERLRARVMGRTLAAWTRGRPVPRSESYAEANLDRCLDALQAPQFATHLRTDDLEVPEVAERVAAEAGLALRPATAGVVRQRLRQQWTTVQHIRWR